MSDPNRPDDAPGGVPYGAAEGRYGQEAGMAASYGAEGHGPSPTEKNRLGTWALIAGIVALFSLLLPVIIAIPLGVLGTAGALVLGILALRAIGRGEADNRPQAVVGLVLGTVGLVLYALAVVGLVALGANAGAA